LYDNEVTVFRSFKKAFNDVILSRRAIRNMNTLYPDATPEELAAADNVCIICREEMITGKQKSCIVLYQ
jgi:E3 ubiquitin-protein ligase synoviolin